MEATSKEEKYIHTGRLPINNAWGEVRSNPISSDVSLIATALSFSSVLSNFLISDVRYKRVIDQYLFFHQAGQRDSSTGPLLLRLF